MSRLRPLLHQVPILAVLGALAVAIGASSGEPPLELTLRARSMSFHLDGEDGPNPHLVLPADRRIRLTFVNEEPGVEHDLTLPELGLRTRVLAGDGSRQTITLRTPAEATAARYECSLHPLMMRGELDIR